MQPPVIECGHSLRTAVLAGILAYPRTRLDCASGRSDDLSVTDHGPAWVQVLKRNFVGLRNVFYEGQAVRKLRAAGAPSGSTMIATLSRSWTRM
jgi:hypothetical protein